ncbi:VWA domain-containing protein [Dyella sp. M7H15-1]|uniref:VWA domain-containing protein n=1 Tax=Dyella sp. M7H15-1 TaxID=2501295 RepID=UPI00100509AB|nr:VWA domain-containing protein [Dyella sp. M7H15-1]QAU24231.1 VWA domain-containing protein [Dyella sp. M7H15-1]
MSEFAWPWVFAFLPLPWFAWRALQPAQPGRALHLPHASLAWRVGDGVTTRSAGSWLLVLGWLCLLAAAARPQTLGPPQPQQHSGRAMMFAVDLSGSMQTPDMQLGGQQLSRFGAVEAIAGDFISRRQGDELGLVLFGTRAFLVTPITYDLHAVRAQLQSATVGLPGTETAIGDAIAVAVKRLAALPEQARVLILLTDGVNNSGSISPQDAAKAAKAAGVRIYAIGIGATRMTVPGLFGDSVINPSADLDADMLTYIARETGGQFYRATDGNQLADAYRAIDALEPMPQQGPRLRLRHELFRLPLIASALCLLLGMLWPRLRSTAA